MRHMTFFLVLTFFWSVAASASTITIDFENLTAGTVVDNQYSSLGVTFSGSPTILTAGVNLNDFDFPPNSGTNVLGDTGGPITLLFTTAMSPVSAFFTYSNTVTLTAFDLNGNVVSQVSSLFNANFTSSGQGSPNELIQIGSSSGISRLVISGASSGNSFAVDDLSFTTASTSAPEPGTAFLILPWLSFALSFLRPRK